jgi:PAS domain S-box-containing protein
MDHQGRIVEFNPAAEQVFGYSFSEVVGKDMADIIIPPSLREAHRSGLAHYLATGKGPIMDNRIELSAIRRDGSEFPVELTVTRTRMSGDPLFSGFIRDITERKRVEAEKNRAIEARDELVAVVSHELKNPMSAIATSAELILRRMPTDQRDSVTVKSLEMIRGSIHRMSRLTSDLLDITKVEAGRLTLNESPQNVAHIIDETLESLRPVAEQKKIKLEKSLEAQLPQAYCDRDRIIQVLSNLIGNAIKFSDEARSVFIEAHSIRDEIEFQVRDQGPGIPPEQVGKVFDRFWQAKQTAFKGAGLGLPISKGIVEAHGGKIWVKSKVGEGSTFFFTLKNLAKSSQITASAS